jgi:hypothetical protein
MARAGPVRKIIVSTASFFAAGLAAAFAFRPNSPTPQHDPEDSLRAILPQADPSLLHRAVQNWGDTAVTALERHSEDGLHVLEAFADEAASYLENQPDAFTALGQVVRLDPTRFRLAAGPWDWAQSGKLSWFVAFEVAKRATDSDSQWVLLGRESSFRIRRPIHDP